MTGNFAALDSMALGQNQALWPSRAMNSNLPHQLRSLCGRDIRMCQVVESGRERVTSPVKRSGTRDSKDSGSMGSVEALTVAGLVAFIEFERTDRANGGRSNGFSGWPQDQS
jgi:hypothetical protein